LSDEEMHTLTLKELSDYQDRLWDAWQRAGIIRKYRITIGDENNVYLLQGKIEIVDEEDED